LGSVVNRLDKETGLPFDEDAFLSGNKARTASYMLELIKVLEERFENIVTIVNFLVDLSDGEAVYSKLKGSDGEYSDGTWRIISAVAADVTADRANAVGDRMIQRKVDGTWTTARLDYGS